MARIKGRDVVLELMEAVGALEKTAVLHARQLGEIATMAVETSARAHGLTTHVGALAKGFSDLSRRMDDMTTRMNDMTTRMHDMTTRMHDMTTRMHDMSTRTNDMSTRMDAFENEAASFEAGLATQAEHTKVAAQTSNQQAQQIGRLSRLIGVFADSSTNRFDDIESRLVVLEKKAS
jgi:methyl-accepting chemotaxis protein